MVNWYGICQSIGFIICHNIFKYRFLHLFPNLTDFGVNYGTIIFMFAAIIGARIMSFLQKEFKFNTIHKIHEGGMSTFGTYYGLLIVAYIFSYIYNLDMIKFSECIMLSTTFHPIVVRLGNYLNGELPGKYSVYLQKRHPSQIYQLVAEGIIISLVLWYFESTIGQGIIFMLMPIMYCIVRCICESFKEEDQGIPEWFEKSLYKYLRWAHFQSICLPIVFLIFYLLCR